MCGLVGIAGDLSYNDKDILKTLLTLSILRGEDSAGVAIVPEDGSTPDIIKTVGTSFELFGMTKFERFSPFRKKALIGHTRKATIGGINKYTAHPFNYEHITGVHNGTLRNWKDLPGDSLATDSMTMYENFARVGVRETIEALDGAYAAVWWDEEKGTLNILRNKERSLYYAFCDGFKKIVWASEAWMINVAINRSPYNLDNMAKEGEEPLYVCDVDVDTWFVLKIDRENKEKRVISFLSEEDLKGGVNKPKTYQAPFRGGTYQSSYRSPFDWEKEKVERLKTEEAQRLSLPGPSRTPVAPVVTPKQEVNSQTQQHQTSQQPRPMLSIVPTSKSDGSESSSAVQQDLAKRRQEAKQRVLASRDSLNDPIPAFGNEVIGYKGSFLNKADYEKTSQQCAFCDTTVTFEDALEGNIECWVNETQLLCTTCHNV
jgi:predicted glutamine amidotransferase